MNRKYWLIKSELSAYSIEDLVRDKRTCWDGVRNYEARNSLRTMQLGDECFFYHSNCEPAHIAGIAKVVKRAYPDFTAFDADDPHYDPKSKPQDPTWFMVDIGLKRSLPRTVSITEMRAEPALKNMALFTRSRLSVQPVTPDEWDTILLMSKRKQPRIFANIRGLGR